MYYSIYSNIRDSAWKCLIDNKIDSLPVDVLKIAKQCNIKVIRNSFVDELLPYEDAKTYCNGNIGVIIYNDLNDVSVSRFAIAHELGHIFLGHEKTFARYSNVEEFGQKSKSEQQADLFALRLPCPSCILMSLDLHSADEIFTACNIPLSWAKKRSLRMTKLYQKNKFFTNPLETMVSENFRSFCESKNAANKASSI